MFNLSEIRLIISALHQKAERLEARVNILDEESDDRMIAINDLNACDMLMERMKGMEAEKLKEMSEIAR
jgi:hypothetical protein